MRRDEDGRSCGWSPKRGTTGNPAGRAPRLQRWYLRNEHARWEAGGPRSTPNVQRSGHKCQTPVMPKDMRSENICNDPSNFSPPWRAGPRGRGSGVIQAHDWPWQWHGRQSAADAACRQALRARTCGQWSPYAQVTAPCRRIVGIPTPDLGQIGFGRGRGFSPVVFPAPLLLV